MSDTGTAPPTRAHGEDEGDAVFGRVFPFVLASVGALFVAARLWRLTSSCLWFDELFSVHATRHDWAGMFRFVAADLIHPPLFYALLKIWTTLGGESLLWLRLFPALAASACIVPFILLCRELKLGQRQTILALLLMATNGYLIKYAQDVRMYSLLMLFALFSLWLFVRFAGACAGGDGAGANRKVLAWLFVVNLLLVYTHYYGWLFVATEITALFLFARRGLPSFSLVTAALALCYTPWVYAVARVAGDGRGLQQNLGWMARPRLADAAQFFVLLNEPFYFRQSSTELLYLRLSAPLGLLLFGVPLLLLLWRVWKSRRTVERVARASVVVEDRESSRDAGIRFGRNGGGHARLTAWLLLFSLLPLALAFILSLILPQSVWGTRHLIIVAAPYMILASVALWALRPRWLRMTLLIILGGWVFFACLFMSLGREGVYIWCAWEGLTGELRQSETQTGGQVRVYAFEDLVAYHLWFAFDTAGDESFKVAVVRNVPGISEDKAYFLPRAFDEVATPDISDAFVEDSFWVAFRDRELSEQRPPLNILKQRGYRISRILESSAQGQRAFLIQVRR